MNLPNFLTTARIAITPFVYYAGITLERELFILLFLLGGLTDVLDGWLARYMGVESDWGTNLDTIADLIFFPTVALIYFFVPEIFTNWPIIVGIIALFFSWNYCRIYTRNLSSSTLNF